MKSKLLILLFAIVSAFVLFNREAYKYNMFRWDASGYYLYLPAAFIYHDIGSLEFYDTVNKKYGMCDEGKKYAIFEEPGGKRNSKYPIGTALFELPFFLVAHCYCLATASCPADGFSPPYQFAGILSTTFWVCMGLLLLSSFLRKYFSEQITAFVVLCIAFGTNIYCYTVFTPGMSHPYGFFLFAAVLYCTDALYRDDQRKYIYWLGLLLGLVIVTRPVNITVAVIPIFWEVCNKQSLLQRFQFFRKHAKDIFIGLILFLLPLLLQMSYWKYTTGEWIHYTYVGEGFNFLRPRIIDGLFSYRKGWFLYTPVALVSMFGLYAMGKANKKATPVIVVFFLLMVYVVFSWKVWAYGGGFSARAMIETLPVAAFPLAYLSQWIYYKQKLTVLKIAFSIVMSFFIVLNLFQSYQYKGNIIHFALMTKAYYWRVFGEIEVSPEDTKYLMSWDDYYKENPGPEQR